MTTIHWKRFALIAAVSCLLAGSGCQSAPPVPEHQYYRLLATATVRDRVLPAEVAVRPLRTDGLYSERAMIFSDDEQRRLQQYHYHHWLYPPGRLVQEHLAEWLSRSGAAPAVRLQDYGGDVPYAISGRVVRCEESRTQGRVVAVVALELRLEKQGRLLWQHAYEASEASADKTAGGLAAAMEVALDRLYGAFVADLKRVSLE